MCTPKARCVRQKIVRTGCQWRHLPPPPAFLPWSTVYGDFRAFLRAGVWESIRHHLVMMLRAGSRHRLATKDLAEGVHPGTGLLIRSHAAELIELIETG